MQSDTSDISQQASQSTHDPAVKQPPANPVQFIRSPWHPEGDLEETEDDLAEAVEHLRAVLKLIPTRTHKDARKARAFVALFDDPIFVVSDEGSEQ